MVAEAIVQGSPEWHDFRRVHVTATDAAVIAGETGSGVELWALKRGLVDPPEFDAETRALMDEGLAIQPYLLDFHRRRTGLDTRAVDGVRESAEWPVASCSPDGEVFGEPIGVECKMTTSARWPAAYRAGEPVPGDVFAQVQWQMYVTGWERVDVVVLLFGRPKIIEVERDDAYIADLVALARQFHGWVESGERPPLDGSENARRVLTALHPRNDGSGLLPAPSDVEGLVRDLAAAKAAAKAADDQVGTLENALRALIGDADGFEGSFGKATWKRNADSTRTNWPAVAEGYRRLISESVDAGLISRSVLESVEAIQSIHTEAVVGPRVLRLTLKENAA